MPPVRRQAQPYAATLAAAIALAALALYLFAAERPFLNNLETQTLNVRFQLRGPIRPGPEIALVLVDDRTIGELGEWPLSRAHFAEAVRTLQRDGARVIAFNLLFADSVDPLPAATRAAINQVRQSLLEQNETKAAALLAELLAKTNPDLEFEAAIQQAGNVLIPFAFTFDQRRTGPAAIPAFLERAAFSRYRAAAGEAGPPLRPSGVLTALPGIAEAARWSGHVTLVFDTDGTPRYEYPVIGYGGEFFPSLPIEAARAFLEVARQDMVALIPGDIRIGDRLVPTDPAMRLLVNYYGPAGSFPTYSLVDAIAERVPPEAFAGKIVLLGGTALGVSDSAASPFTQSLPGAERYATIIDNILHDRFLVRGHASVAIEMLAILIGSALSFIAATRLPVPWAIACAVGLLAAWSGGTLLAFAHAGLWINLTLPASAFLVSFAALLAARVLAEERRRRQAERQRANLGRYFSPNVLEQLAASDAPFLFDRNIEAAVMFVDIVGFTRLSETMVPSDAIALLRAFHRHVEAAVFAHDGTLDKFLGDGALATFGPPVPSVGDAANALACARALAAAVERWSAGLAASGLGPVEIGIGLHYGPVLMGDVGGERRFEFTVVGDTVNVANRLETLTRTLCARILASDALIAAARATAAGAMLAADFTLLPPQHLRGRDEAVLVWAWPCAAALPE